VSEVRQKNTKCWLSDIRFKTQPNPSLIVKAINLRAKVIYYINITYCVIHTNIQTQTNVLHYVWYIKLQQLLCGIFTGNDDFFSPKRTHFNDGFNVYTYITNGENRLVRDNGFFGILCSSSATGKSIIICWPRLVDRIVIASLILYIYRIIADDVFFASKPFIRTSNGVLFYRATL